MFLFRSEASTEWVLSLLEFPTSDWATSRLGRAWETCVCVSQEICADCKANDLFFISFQFDRRVCAGVKLFLILAFAFRTERNLSFMMICRKCVFSLLVRAQQRWHGWDCRHSASDNENSDFPFYFSIFLSGLVRLLFYILRLAFWSLHCLCNAPMNMMRYVVCASRC